MRDIVYNILSEFGWEFILNVRFAYFFYFTIPFLVLYIVFLFVWRKVEGYSRLMDALVIELWRREEAEVANDNVSDDVKKIRMERLKGEYNHKIKEIRKKRDRILRFFPFMKLIYKMKKGTEAPLFSSL